MYNSGRCFAVTNYQALAVMPQCTFGFLCNVPALVPNNQYAFDVYSYVGPDAIWIMMCEAIVVLFILYFLVTEIKKLRKVSVPLVARGV